MTYATIKARDRAILIAIKTGSLTYRQIAKLYGISSSRVGQIADEARTPVKPPTIADELTTRIRNALDAEGCPISPKAVAKRYTLAELKRVPNLGALSIRQLNSWLQKHGQKEIR